MRGAARAGQRPAGLGRRADRVVAGRQCDRPAGAGPAGADARAVRRRPAPDRAAGDAVRHAQEHRADAGRRAAGGTASTTPGRCARRRSRSTSGQRSVTQWQAIPAARAGPPRQPGGVIDFDRSYDGVDARLALALGRAARWSPAQRSTASARTAAATRTSPAPARRSSSASPAGCAATRTTARRSDDVYAQAEVDLAPTRRPPSSASRSGTLAHRDDDRYLSNGDDSGALDFRYTTPVAALRWQPRRA